MKKIIVSIALVSLFLWGSYSTIITLTNNKEVVTKDIGFIQAQTPVDSVIKALTGYTIEDPYIELDPYNKTPLSALIAFESEREVEVSLEVVGKNGKNSIKHSFEPTKQHFIPVFGLYADYLNTVILTIEGKDYSFSIQTEKLPENFIVPSLITKDENFQTDSLYFVTPSNLGFPAAYDQEGEVRWFYSEMGIWDINRLDNGHIVLSTERLISTPYYTTGFYELDLLGKIYSEYSLEGGYHHDIFEMENGNLLVASDDFSKGTVEDIIVEIDRLSGKVIKQFDLKEILPQEEGKSYAWSKTDWFHNNSVWYDAKTNSILLSGRHQDAVVSIDYETKALNWIIGDSTNWSEDMQKYFFKPMNEVEWQWSQHAAMVLPNGDIFVLDNGNNRSKLESDYIAANDNYTRGVIYRINTDNMTIEQVYQYGKERGSSFYSPYISDVDYIAENHYLIHSGGIGSINGEAINVPPAFVPGAQLNSITVEVVDNEVVFEMHLPSNFYRAEKMMLYHNGVNYGIEAGVEKGTLGKTPISEEKMGFSLPEVVVPSTYELEVSQQKDRLIITGLYNKVDVVDVVLRKGFSERYYPIMISDNQYTAMCVYLPNKNADDTKLTVSKYINNDGLEGSYNVYIRINGVLYNTNYLVNF